MLLNNKQNHPGVVVLELSGRLQMGADCKRLETEIDRLLEMKEHFVILEMAGVDHIDSAFVGQIVKTFTRLSKSGGALRMAGVKGMADGVLRMTQVNRVIPMFSNVDHALKDFPPPAAGPAAAP